MSFDLKKLLENIENFDEKIEEIQLLIADKRKEFESSVAKYREDISNIIKAKKENIEIIDNNKLMSIRVKDLVDELNKLTNASNSEVEVQFYGNFPSNPESFYILSSEALSEEEVLANIKQNYGIISKYDLKYPKLGVNIHSEMNYFFRIDRNFSINDTLSNGKKIIDCLKIKSGEIELGKYYQYIPYLDDKDIENLVIDFKYEDFLEDSYLVKYCCMPDANLLKQAICNHIEHKNNNRR